MVVILNWKALETALINMPLTGGAVVRVVSLRMGERHPAKKVAHRPILSGLKHKVPMIGHQLVTQDSARVTLKTFTKNPLKSIVVFRLLENFTSGIRSIERVIDTVGFIGSLGSWHSSRLSQHQLPINDS
jgi:hypothetical protein